MKIISAWHSRCKNEEVMTPALLFVKIHEQDNTLPVAVHNKH